MSESLSHNVLCVRVSASERVRSDRLFQQSKNEISFEIINVYFFYSPTVKHFYWEAVALAHEHIARMLATVR